jgi:hypothetical protein
MEYPKISIDKVDQEIHRFEQTPMAEPVVQQQQQKAAITGTTSPVAPPPQVTAPVQTASAPQAPPPDLSGMVSNVTSNYATMQNQMPEPKLPVDTGLKLLGGLGLLAAGGLGLHKLFGEKEAAPIKPGSIESRKIGSGPQMNVDTSEPRMVGGLFPADVSTKPITTKSVETPKTFEQLQAEYEVLKKNHASTMQEYEANKKAFYEKHPSVLSEMQALSVPENPTVPLKTEVGKAPKEMPMIEQGLANKEINAVAEGRKQEALKPVEPPKTAPKAKIPMPEGWGKGMSWLVNQHGVEGAQDFIDRYNNGKPFESHNQMEARRQEVTIRPKFSDIPKSVRKERGITAAIVPPSPPSGGGMAVPPRTGAGGRLNETGRPGEEIIHNLNPLKL